MFTHVHKNSIRIHNFTARSSQCNVAHIHRHTYTQHTRKHIHTLLNRYQDFRMDTHTHKFIHTLSSIHSTTHTHTHTLDTHTNTRTLLLFSLSLSLYSLSLSLSILSLSSLFSPLPFDPACRWRASNQPENFP